MIIKSLVFKDFLIFYGRQKLELGGGLYVMHGENGRGKSTFLSGISWAFLGEFRNRQGKLLPDSVLLNRDAEREGETEVSVELVLDVEGVEVVVRRTHSSETNETHLFVQRGGVTQDQQDAEIVLRGLLDKDVARFFLFDGEELRRYEELLEAGEDGAAEVRRSIEHILGLPALTNAVADLQSVADTFRKQATKAAAREGHAAQAVLLVKQCQTALDDAVSDRDQLAAQRDAQMIKVEEASEILQRFDSSREILLRKVEVEGEIAALRKQGDDANSARQHALAEAWRDVLAGAVKPKRDAYMKQLESSRARALVLAEIKSLEESLSDGACDQCGQKLKEDASNKIAKTVAELNESLPADSSTEDTQNAVIALTAITPVGRLGDAIEEDRKVRRVVANVAIHQQELDELSSSTRAIPEADIRAASAAQDSANQAIGVIDEKIAGVEVTIAAARTALRNAEDDAGKASTSAESASLRKSKALAEKLADLFGAAIESFRDDRRAHIGADASAIFKILTTSPEYQGLEINQNYGLVTLGPDGKPVPGRSSGQEQIVAFSLIGALNRNATRTAPVVMDTPLGRLDSGHREKVLAYLSDMADQVFLLVHSAELDDADLDPIRSGISAEFEMRKESAFRTSIQKKGGE